MKDITCSIVLYKNRNEVVEPAIRSFLRCALNIKLYLIDNSPTEELKAFSQIDERIEYIKTRRNVGFGKAHNIALRKAITESKYHLVLNPDVWFGANVLEQLIEFMDDNPDVGQVMPKVLYPDGSAQYLCKLLPTPFDLIFRRFFGFLRITKNRNRVYELQESGYDKIMNVPYLSGCFMLFRTLALREVGLFEEKIFMYIEDADLTRRMHRKFRTIFYPHAQITHAYQKGSYKSFKLMLYNMHGAIVYFMKWGWFFDSERRRINQTVVKNYLLK